MSAESHHSMATLTRLRRERAEAREAMRALVSEVSEARPHLRQRPRDSHAAPSVYAWYTALEAAAERALRVLDGELPEGDRWHRDLLSQATVEVLGVRPALVPRSLLPDLLALLAFRHFVRHA